MLIKDVHEVFEAERILTPRLPLTDKELARFKKWSMQLTDRLGCTSSIITGSVSRQHAHPFSDIDLELYTDKRCGVQSFCHWEGRMVSIHIEPKWEMREEVTDPYYQVWHRATLRDGLVVKDTDGFIRSIAGLAGEHYHPQKTAAAINRLTQEASVNRNLALGELQHGNLPGSLYHFSYFLQHVGVRDCLLKNETMRSEIGLARRFADLADKSLTPEATLPVYIARALCAGQADLALTQGGSAEIHQPAILPPVKTWKEARIALRRILEYRRKIYGCDDLPEDQSTKLFRLYCLGRVLGNFNTLSGSKFDGTPAASDSHASMLRLTQQKLDSPLNGERMASDIVMASVCRMLLPAQPL